MSGATRHAKAADRQLHSRPGATWNGTGGAAVPRADARIAGSASSASRTASGAGEPTGSSGKRRRRVVRLSPAGCGRTQRLRSARRSPSRRRDCSNSPATAWRCTSSGNAHRSPIRFRSSSPSAKDLAYALLARAGVRVPEHIVVRRDDRAAARAFLEPGPVPVVVKPARGGGAGQGVTPSIETASQLERALRRGGTTSELLVVERQAVGEQFRFLLLDGEVLDVIRRDRPQVVGDGTSTIEELMFAEYDRRVGTDTTEGTKPFPVDLDCLFTLERQGLRISTRPPKGTTVVVKSASNISGGRTCVTVREPVAPEVVHEVRAAAAARRCSAGRRRRPRSGRRETPCFEQWRRARGESDSRPGASLQRRGARSGHPGGRSGARGAIRAASRRGPAGVAGRPASACRSSEPNAT